MLRVTGSTPVSDSKLFQELFAKCSGVLCSTGNETVWEAACRGVPVLTIPTGIHAAGLKPAD